MKKLLNFIVSIDSIKIVLRIGYKRILPVLFVDKNFMSLNNQRRWMRNKQLDLEFKEHSKPKHHKEVQFSLSKGNQPLICQYYKDLCQDYSESL